MGTPNRLDFVRAPRDGSGDRPVGVIQLAGYRGCNPYADILRDALRDGGFDRPGRSRKTPRVALLHWTENIWLDSTSRGWLGVRNSIIRRGLPLFLKMLRARGYKVIWFAHNATPHDWQGSAEEWFRRSHAFYENIDAVVHLTNASSHMPVFERFHHLPRTVVRHPHYDLVAPAVHAGKAGPVRRLLMLGGASEPRKNAYAAVQEIRNIPNLRTVVTGDLDSEVAYGIRSLPNVELIPGILDESALFALFDGSTAVLLNQPNQLNSGCMFLGLSRGAPVICPDTPSNREVRSLVGPEWIRLFEAPLSGELLAELIKEPVPADLPDLSPFSPDLVGKAFRDWVDADLALNSVRRNRKS
jgi:beta-1,4-mannosyltransferase